MLVDVTLRRSSDPVLEIIGGGRQPQRLQQGIYQMPHWNPEYLVAEKLKDSPDPWTMMRWLTDYERLLPEDQQLTIRQQIFRQAMDEHRRGLRQMRRLYSQRYKRNFHSHDLDGPTYGVIDYPTQLIERFPHLADDDIARMISVVEIRRDDQPSSGGWRYHKWGPYLGRQKPRAEYLYDDTHIDVVWTFHVYRVITS